MQADQVKVEDKVAINVEREVGERSRDSYTVISENGLFKNGKQYDTGDEVMLDWPTAQAFIEAGDIK